MIKWLRLFIKGGYYDIPKGNQEGNRFISNSDEKEINFDDLLNDEEN